MIQNIKRQFQTKRYGRYFINKVNDGNYTLFLSGGPGQDPFKYNEQFKDINYITMDYTKHGTQYIIEEILELLKVKKIRVDNIIGFSFGTFVSHYLQHYLKDIKNVFIVGSVGLDIEKKDNIKPSDKYQQLLKKLRFDKEYTDPQDYYDSEKETLKLAGFPEIEVVLDKKLLKVLKIQNDYILNNYFQEHLIEPSYEEINRPNKYFYIGNNDKLTAPELTYDYIDGLKLTNYKVFDYSNGYNSKHTLSGKIENILKIIKESKGVQ